MSTQVINFTLNGEPVSTAIEPHRNLVELLQRFDLLGARESCGQGLCGCCTVLVDDVAVSGCLYFGVWVDGKTVTTVEHLDADGALSNVQQAFIDCGAFQCGFCTPGFVLMTHQLLERESRSERRRHPALSLRQSLPLRRLSGDHRSGETRGQSLISGALDFRRSCDLGCSIKRRRGRDARRCGARSARAAP